MPTLPTPITPYGTPPSSNDPVNFDARADAKVAHDVVVVGQMNDLAENVFANAEEAFGSAEEAAAAKAGADDAAEVAQAAAVTSAQHAGADEWEAGNYAEGAVVYSLDSGLVYRRKAPGGASPTDPAADPTRWRLAIIAAPLYRPETGASVAGEVNVHHGLRYAGAQELVLPVAPEEGDIFWYSVENGRTDNYFTTGGAKVNGEVQATLTLDDPFANGMARYSGPAYGWIV